MMDDMYYDTDFMVDSEHNYDWSYEDIGLDDHYLDSSEIKTQIDFYEFLISCIIPTLTHVFHTIYPILISCFIFQSVYQYCNVKNTMKHLLSASLGIAILILNFHYLVIHPILLCLFSYIYILFVPYWRYKSTLLIVVELGYLVYGEFCVMKKSWQKIHNVQMIMVMKVISIVIDTKRNIHVFPTFSEFCGYMLCVGNCMFGPWVSYKHYLMMYKYKKWNINYFAQIVISLSLSMVFFMISVCYADWFIPNTEYKILTMYKRAFEFRASHYFIMFLSETISLVSGLGYIPENERSEITDSYVVISKPLPIELPHSLVEVVVYWNVPMHKWFRNYVFVPTKPYGKFLAVLCTYVISSILHGLNYQLSAVLLSLALFTYIEHMIRVKFAIMFDACVLSRRCAVPCKEHTYQSNNIFVFLANIFFTILALYHLNYLGYLIDAQGLELGFFEAFARWKNVDFNSHIIAFFTYIIYRLI